jgi:hypothetical protein
MVTELVSVTKSASQEDMWVLLTFGSEIWNAKMGIGVNQIRALPYNTLTPYRRNYPQIRLGAGAEQQ